LKKFVLNPTPENWIDKIRNMVHNHLKRMEEMDCMRQGEIGSCRKNNKMKIFPKNS